MFKPLLGKRVIDLSRVLAGPFATYQLALLGAEVIKIERPGTGDWTRTGAAPAGLESRGMATAFLTQNAGKRSLILDLVAEADRSRLLALVETADVFVENFRPGVAESLGLSFDTILSVKPDIVYCSLSAFGQDGPIGHRAAYDHVVQGMCGIMRTTGTPETEPNKVGAPYIDYATGLNGAFAIVSALHEIKRTGKGLHLDVAMLDTALLLMASLMTNHLNTGWQPVASGNEAWSQAPASGAFETAAGTVMIAANTERQFHDFCHAVGLDAVLGDPRFAGPETRRKNLTMLRTMIAERMTTASADHWETVLDRAGVPAARIRSLDEVLAEPQVKARAVTLAIDVPDAARALHMPTLGFKVNGQVVGPELPPPLLGADTEAILGTLPSDSGKTGPPRRSE